MEIPLLFGIICGNLFNYSPIHFIIPQTRFSTNNDNS